MADLGAVRPFDDDERQATGTAVLSVRPSQPGLQIHGSRPKWPRIGGRGALLVAGVAGALLFAGATGFGRNVRPSQSLFSGLDQMLVGAGLGINEIALTGHRQTLDRDIFRALGAGRASLLFFDVGAARQRIEALPWIESASLVRILPDKLKVEVRERRAAAAWLDGDRVALVDATGRRLAHVATFVPTELPRIAGAGAPEAVAELIAALAHHPDIAARLRVAHRIGERRWDLELAGETRVHMAAGPLLPSLKRLIELNHETQVLEQGHQVVDLTQSGSIAVSTAPERGAGDRRTSARLSPARPL